MINFIRTFVDDTLKVKGKYSMKRVIVAVFVPYTLYIGVYVAKTHNANPYGIQVFTGLLGFITLIVAGTIIAKKQEIKSDTDQNTETE